MDAIETYERDGIVGSLYYDEYPEPPYDDGGSPILYVDWDGRYDRYKAEQVNQSSFTVPDEILNAARRFGTRDEFDRYLRIFHGASEVETWSDRDGSYVAFDTAAWRKYTGAPRESVDTSEYRAYLAGDVYYYVAGDDSCGGFIGYDYALEELRAAVDYQAEQQHQERVELYRRLVNTH